MNQKPALQKGIRVNISQVSLRNLRDFEYNCNWVNCNLKHSNSFVTADYIWPITYVESLSVNFFIWISKVRLKKRYIQLPMYAIDEQSITSGLRVFSCGQTAGFNTCKLKSEYQKNFIIGRNTSEDIVHFDHKRKVYLCKMCFYFLKLIK